MKLFSGPIILFLLITFISLGSWTCRTEDCGGLKVANTIIVDQSGKGSFKQVQAAIDSIPENNNGWVKVHINPGIYTETVNIPVDKPCIILEGEGRKFTTITYSEPHETYKSSTFISAPGNVIAKGITFKNVDQNSFNMPKTLDLGHSSLGDAKVTQAVAATIYGDKTAFFDCGFIGFQDTLWDVIGRDYFKRCYIQGAIDFIFGKGQSFYEDCLLNVTSQGSITAQNRDSEDDPSGFVFRKGFVFGSSNNGQTLLGRAYGPYSRVLFHSTYLDAVVDPRGWDAWNFCGKEGNFTYAETNCTGPGADTSKRVLWEKKLDPSQLKAFTKKNFINQDGWLNNLPI